MAKQECSYPINLTAKSFANSSSYNSFQASLKASFEAINLGVQTHEFRIGQEIAGAAQVRYQIHKKIPMKHFFLNIH